MTEIKTKNSKKTIIDELDFCEPINKIKETFRSLDEKKQLKKQQLIQRAQNGLQGIQNDLSFDISNNESIPKTNINDIGSEDQQLKLQIAGVIEKENENLKKQNFYLYEKVRKMQLKQRKYKQVREKKDKYKELYIQTLQELEKVKKASQKYHDQAQYIKNVTIQEIEKLRIQVDPQKVEEDCKSLGSENYASYVTKCTNASNQQINSSEQEYE